MISFFFILRKRENTLGHATLSVELLFEGSLLFLLLPFHLFFFCSILILPKKPCRFSVNYVTFPDERLIITFSAASHRHETIMRFVEIRNLPKKDISTKEKKNRKIIRTLFSYPLYTIKKYFNFINLVFTFIGYLSRKKQTKSKRKKDNTRKTKERRHSE